MAGSFDMVIDKGATFQRTLRITNDGNPLVLDGYSARMKIATTSGAGKEVIFEANTTNGKLVISDSADGKLSLTMSATETDAVAVTRAVYDLEIEDAVGVVTRLLQGYVIFSDSVTK